MSMKIEGTVNIMGMSEVIIREKLPAIYDHQRDEFDIIATYVRRRDPKMGILWYRLIGGHSTGFYRTNEEMISSIKSMSFNPNITLTFNDGAMYVDFPYAIKAMKDCEKFVKKHEAQFVKALEEMLES
jgi:hypothetical protein